MATTEPPAAPPPEAAPAPPSPAKPSYPDFDGNEIIQRCHDGSGYLPQVFASDYQGHTLVWSGTVARYNPSEGLIVFKGGGLYPYNWDLQISSTDHTEFPLYRKVRFRFRLNKMLVMRFVGISFRGDHLHKL